MQEEWRWWNLIYNRWAYGFDLHKINDLYWKVKVCNLMIWGDFRNFAWGLNGFDSCKYAIKISEAPLENKSKVWNHMDLGCWSFKLYIEYETEIWSSRAIKGRWNKVISICNVENWSNSASVLIILNEQDEISCRRLLINLYFIRCGWVPIKKVHWLFKMTRMGKCTEGCKIICKY